MSGQANQSNLNSATVWINAVMERIKSLSLFLYENYVKVSFLENEMKQKRLTLSASFLDQLIPVMISNDNRFWIVLQLLFIGKNR